MDYNYKNCPTFMNDLQNLVSMIARIPFTYSRWIPHNCPACVHVGHPRPDTKNRGGALFQADGSYSYHCFNCDYKVHYKPGFDINSKFIDLMKWYGASNEQLMSLTLIVEELKKTNVIDKSNNSYISTNVLAKELPIDAIKFSDLIQQQTPPSAFMHVLTHVYNRNPHLLDSIELYWSPSSEHNLKDRFIIPFYMNSRIIGYTARSTKEYIKLKYFNQYPSNVLYNFDELNSNSEMIYVTEGPIDACLINGVATCHYTLKENQIQWLKNTKKKIVIVPDRDRNGKIMVEQAIACGFSVSMPDWGTKTTENGRELIKDIDEAVNKYGRLFTAFLLNKNILSDESYIRLRSKQWF